MEGLAGVLHGELGDLQLTKNTYQDVSIEKNSRLTFPLPKKSWLKMTFCNFTYSLSAHSKALNWLFYAVGKKLTTMMMARFELWISLVRCLWFAIYATTNALSLK